MKIINVFIGSSIKTFAYERKKITLIMQKINDVLVESAQPTYINLHMSEFSDMVFMKSRSQDYLNELILKSDYAFFMIKNALGEYTLEELKEAIIHKNEYVPTKIYIFTFSETCVALVETLKKITKGHAIDIVAIENFDKLIYEILMALKNQLDLKNISVNNHQICIDDIFISNI